MKTVLIMKPQIKKPLLSKKKKKRKKNYMANSGKLDNFLQLISKVTRFT